MQDLWPKLANTVQAKTVRDSAVVFQLLKLTLPITINSHTPSQLLSVTTVRCLAFKLCIHLGHDIVYCAWCHVLLLT